VFFFFLMIFPYFSRPNYPSLVSLQCHDRVRVKFDEASGLGPLFRNKCLFLIKML
jgi:hypothetical protein